MGQLFLTIGTDEPGVVNKIPTEEIIEFDNFIKFTTHLRDLVKKADRAPEIQTEIIRKIVHKVEVTLDGFEISFHVGKGHLKRELGPQHGSRDLLATNGLVSNDRGEEKSAASGVRPSSRPLSKFLKDRGSKRLTNGGPTRTRDEHQ